MISDEAIRTAMDGLVEKFGLGHRAKNRYQNADGTGECFLGALCEFMVGRIPGEGIAATNVLGRDAVSERMKVAFSVAQAINDSGYEWKYVLYGVDEVLKADESTFGAECPCGCQTRDAGWIIAKVRQKRAHDRAVANMGKPQNPALTYAAGGIVTGGTIKSIEFTSLTTSLGTITINVDALSSSFAELAQAWSTPLYKKDHALTA